MSSTKKECGVMVLVVDDDPAIRDALEILLGAYGLPVRTFQSGPDFLARAESHEPGCLVLDIHMPEMNGFDLLKRIEAGGRLLPTVMMSSRADEETKRNAVKAGAIGILEKPFDSDELFAALETLTSPFCRPASQLA